MDVKAEFRLSKELDSPVTFGLAAPVILLPERFVAMEQPLQSAIACHELLHVRRRDWAHHLGEELLRAVFWFHPAIAWSISRVRLAREQVVDQEVIRLTQERKSYVQALLEFARGGSIAAIPAPLFLAERQLVERVSVMLKEVRMSRRRLIVSVMVIVCCLVLVTALSAWKFPLKAAPRPAQSAPGTGIAGGVAGGVSVGPAGGVSGGMGGGISDGVSGGPAGGVSGGASGGVAGGVSRGIGRGVSGDTRGQAGEPEVDVSTIWVDTVKRGLMVRQVRGLGTLVRDSGAGDVIARVMLPEAMTKEVRVNQNVSVGVRGDLNTTANQRIIGGRVLRVGAGGSGEAQSVDIELSADRKFAVTPGTSVSAVIDIEQLNDVLHVGRPANAGASASAPLFRIAGDGKEAERVSVKFGRASVTVIEVLEGLKEGDRVILSDMSSFDGASRIRLTDEKHLTSR